MSARKFKAAVHHICWKCQEHPSKLGATKLNKILWYADTHVYQISGQSITGAKYVKQQFGPVPARILETLAELRSEGKVVSREPTGPYHPREFLALSAPEAGVLSDQEQTMLDSVTEFICDGFTAVGISNETHDQVWDAALLGEEIPMYTAFARFPAEVTKKDMAWAGTKVREVARIEA